MSKKALYIAALFFALHAVGCAGAPYRRSPNFDAALPRIKTIAVLPPDVKVYQLSAGGISEEMDEWSQKAKASIVESLKQRLGSNYHLELKFITEDWMKANQKVLWRQQKAMYEAVAISAMTHTYSATEKFPDKVKNFDYTMGSDVTALAQATGADGLLFINGSDTQETAGHVALSFLKAAVLGYYELHPSFFSLSLVDGKTGDLLWMNIVAGGQDYNFLNPKHIDVIVQCVTKDFIASKK
jgi:hypothetical protein